MCLILVLQFLTCCNIKQGRSNLVSPGFFAYYPIYPISSMVQSFYRQFENAENVFLFLLIPTVPQAIFIDRLLRHNSSATTGETLTRTECHQWKLVSYHSELIHRVIGNKPSFWSNQQGQPTLGTAPTCSRMCFHRGFEALQELFATPLGFSAVFLYNILFQP